MVEVSQLEELCTSPFCAALLKRSRGRSDLSDLFIFWDITGALAQPPLDLSPFQKSVGEALKEDWKAVGKHFEVFLPLQEAGAEKRTSESMLALQD